MGILVGLLEVTDDVFVLNFEPDVHELVVPEQPGAPLNRRLLVQFPGVHVDERACYPRLHPGGFVQFAVNLDLGVLAELLDEHFGHASLGLLRGRRGLEGCHEYPVLFGFGPLGDLQPLIALPHAGDDLHRRGVDLLWHREGLLIDVHFAGHPSARRQRLFSAAQSSQGADVVDVEDALASAVENVREQAPALFFDRLVATPIHRQLDFLAQSHFALRLDLVTEQRHLVLEFDVDAVLQLGSLVDHEGGQSRSFLGAHAIRLGHAT